MQDKCDVNGITSERVDSSQELDGGLELAGEEQDSEVEIWLLESVEVRLTCTKQEQ